MTGFLFLLLTHSIAFFAGALLIGGSKKLYNRAANARAKIDEVLD